MEGIEAHRRREARTCRTRPSYILPGPILAFWPPQAGKANQILGMHQRDLCNISLCPDHHQPPALLAGGQFCPPPLGRQRLLQGRCLVHQQAAE